MISTFKKAARTLREDGAASFLSQVGYRIRNYAKALYWRIRRTQRLTIAGTSVKFTTPNSRVANRNAWRFETEAEQISDILDELDGGEVFYDVGSNTGLYALFVATDKPAADVIAFEPYPPNYDLLERNTALNGTENVNTRQLALSNSSGQIQFDQPAVADAGYGSATISTDQDEEAVTVQTERGDQLIAEEIIPHPNVVKMDVEGSEPLVIQGMEDALSSPMCRALYLELHLPGQENRPSVEDFDSSAAAILDSLDEFGFKITVVNERENELFIKGVKQP